MLTTPIAIIISQLCKSNHYAETLNLCKLYLNRMGRGEVLVTDEGGLNKLSWGVEKGAIFDKHADFKLSSRQSAR